MATEKDIKEKWQEVLNYATEHATKKGMHTGVKWLEDSFNEYLDMSEKVPGYSMGGQPGSMHNREVLAEKILLKLGNHIGGDHVLSEMQELKLKESLSGIVEGKSQSKNLKL